MGALAAAAVAGLLAVLLAAPPAMTQTTAQAPAVEIVKVYRK